ncbi:glutathione S-transferase C-terminal domain-containing protein [Sulfitobacter sp. HNIBRBA2951]|uniref:glutathione S-transferase C-terminal domain-containing protein n=1 Tax=Sulfitobacter aquimarinus TaxID=3158557 RepID=UPI0032E01914
MRTMHGQGIGRLTVAQRLTRIEPDLQAIAHQLGDRVFLFGDTPRAADAGVGAILGAVMAAPAPTGLSRRVSGDAKLAAYVARCEAAMG